MSQLKGWLAWWPWVAILLLAFNLRPVAISVGPVLVDITADLGLSGFEAGLLTSLPALSFAAFGVLAPGLSQRIGPQWSIALAICLILTGQLGRSLVDSGWAFLALSALALSGMAIANVLMPGLVRLYFPKRIGLATAMYSLTISIGVTIASSVTVPLAISLGGWRAALAAGGVVTIASLLCWLPLLRRTRSAAAHLEAPIGVLDVARTKLGWAMAIFFAIQSGEAYSVFGWLPSIYQSAGLSDVNAGFMLGIATGAGIVPAFVIPAYVSRIENPRWLLLAIMAFLAAGHTGLLLAPTVLPWLWAFFLAMGLSCFPLILALLGLRANSTAGTNALSGFTQSLGYLLAAAGPILVGMIYSYTGSWQPSLLLLLILVAPMTVAGWYCCKPIHIEDQLKPRKA